MELTNDQIAELYSSNIYHFTETLPLISLIFFSYICVMVSWFQVKSNAIKIFFEMIQCRLLVFKIFSDFTYIFNLLRSRINLLLFLFSLRGLHTNGWKGTFKIRLFFSKSEISEKTNLTCHICYYGRWIWNKRFLIARFNSFQNEWICTNFSSFTKISF